MLAFQHDIFATNDQGCTQVVKSTEGPQYFEGLHAKLTGWHEDQGTKTIELGPAIAVQTLHNGDQVRECFSTSSSSAADNVASSERVLNR